MRIIVFTLIFISVFDVGQIRAQQCQSKGAVRVGGSGVGGTCISRFASNACIVPGQVYIKIKNSWRPLSDRTVSSIPTIRRMKWDPELRREIIESAYEYLFISDLRKSPQIPAVVGIVATRFTENKDFPKVSLFRNETNDNSVITPEFTAQVRTEQYQGYIKSPGQGGAIISEIVDWMDVPGYDSNFDKSRASFAYRASEKNANNWKIAMKLRLTTKTVSCTWFKLGHHVGVKSLTLRAFIQHRSDPIEEFTASFRK